VTFTRCVLHHGVTSLTYNNYTTWDVDVSVKKFKLPLIIPNEFCTFAPGQKGKY
jgi:hypothetical protein